MNNHSVHSTGTLSFIASNLRWLLGGLCLTIFSSFGQTFFISLFAAEIRSEFDLTHGGFGALYMLGTLGSAITLVLIGKIVDHYTVKWIGIGVCLSLAGACLLMSYSNTVYTLLAAIFTLRLFGQGMMTHVAMTAMGRWYSAERGRAVSIATIGHQIGEGTLPLIAVILVTAVGWRNTWVVAAFSLILFAAPVLFFLMQKERTPKHTKSGEDSFTGKQWTRKEVLQDRYFWITTAGVMAPAFIGTSFFFHQVHLAEMKQWPITVIASGFSVLAITTLLFALISGWLIDKFSARQLLGFPLLPLALACWLLGTFQAPSVLYVYMVFLGISYGFSSSLFGALWPEIYGVKHLGAIRSMIMAMMVFSSALGPGVTGWFIDRGIEFDFQLWVMAGYCLIAAAVMAHVAVVLQNRHEQSVQTNDA